ncbi:hypothetical protein [Georgenia sp. Z1491]|uniref:hypothetical protein n=1 Tax=Georgenia sp. Z1491 TaxID=3416707 RepID=UPI003CE7EA18
MMPVDTSRHDARAARADVERAGVADKPSNPIHLEAALRLTRPGAVIVIDNVVRDGAVVDPSLEATAVQTVGVKGWDGLIVLRRR